jgi:hypothetical protein
LSGLIAYPGPNPVEDLMQDLDRPFTHSPTPDKPTVPQLTDPAEAQT